MHLESNVAYRDKHTGPKKGPNFDSRGETAILSNILRMGCLMTLTAIPSDIMTSQGVGLQLTTWATGTLSSLHALWLWADLPPQ
jgi:hypothetical protein